MSPGPKGISGAPEAMQNLLPCLIPLVWLSLDFVSQRNIMGLLQMMLVDYDLGERWGEKEEVGEGMRGRR